MNKIITTITAIAMAIGAQAQLTNESGKISFHSEKEDITATNSTFSSTLSMSTGDLTFEVSISDFVFANKTMGKHFNNEGIMNSIAFPSAFFKGKIINNGLVDYTADGTYKISVKGTMTIKGVSKDLTAKGEIKISNGKISASSSFDLDRFEYGVDAKEKSVSKVLSILVEVNY